MAVDTTIILRRDTALNLWAPTALADAVGSLHNDGAGGLTWSSSGGGITGPVSSTITALVRWDDALGTAVRDSNVTLSNSGTALAFSGAAGLTAGGSNQNVTLTPSGTGKSVLAGPVKLSALGVGVLQSDASGNITSSALSAGDFSGPSSATDTAIVLFDGTTGKLGKNSTSTISANGELVVTGASTATYRKAVTMQADAGKGIEFAMNNSHAGGSLKSQLSFYSQNNLKWAFGNDSAENGTDDFWIYQNSATDFRFQIKSTGLLQLKAYGAGALQSDASGNITSGPFSGTPAGANTQIQYNSGGAMGASSKFAWDDAGVSLNIYNSAGSANATIRKSADNQGALLWFMNNAGSTWLTGSPYNGASPTGREYVLQVYNGSTVTNVWEVTQAGAFSFPQVPLTTGLSIAIATKSFPFTINGTTVNVLCQ